jgi:hypothetical protein
MQHDGIIAQGWAETAIYVVALQPALQDATQHPRTHNSSPIKSASYIHFLLARLLQ